MTWVGGVDTYIKYQYGNEIDSAVSRVDSRVKSLRPPNSCIRPW